MNESTERLLSAVDALTKPVVEHHRQTDDDGKFLGTHTVEHASLLEQLRAAVNPSSNTAAGSASLASTRNLINTQALFLYSKIAAAVGDWARMASTEPTRDPAVALRRWYVRFTAYEGEADWYTAELNRWAGRIRNLLDPPKTVELLPPCPVCKATVWVNDDGETVPHPVVLEYRVTAEGRVPRPRVSCRACGEAWDSMAAIEELAEELSEKVGANV